MDYCSYCEAAKRLLSRRGIAFQEIRVPMSDDATWDELFQRSGMKTMPQIYADGKLIGGYRELLIQDEEDGLAYLKE